MTPEVLGVIVGWTLAVLAIVIGFALARRRT
jgi:hypothetical protein